MALTKALQKRIDQANKYIKFAQKHDIVGQGYFGSTWPSAFTYPHLITVSPTGRSVRVRYHDAYGKKEKHSESFNTNDEYQVSDLRHEISNYIIKAIKNGAKEEGISIPKALVKTYRSKRKNSPKDETERMAKALAAAKTPEAIADLNDWAVNTIRESHRGTMGEKIAMLRDEMGRVRGKTLAQYMASSRQGARYRINRQTKRAVYILLATRSKYERLNPHHPYPKKSFQIDRVSDLTKLAKETGGKFQLDPNSGYFSGGENIYFWDSHGRNWYFKADEFDSKARSRLASAIGGLTYTEFKHSPGRFGSSLRTAHILGLADDSLFRDNSKPRKRKNAGLNIVTVKFKNSKYNYETEVSPNTTAKSAYEYFVGQSFDMGSYPRENIQRVIGIDFNGKPVAAKRRKNPDHKGEVNPYSKRYTYMDFTKKFWGKNWRDVPRDIRLSFWDDFKLAFVGGLQKYKEATRG